MKKVREVLSGFWSLITGMRITGREFLKSDVNVPYPHKALEMPARYRGPIVFVKDETTPFRCIACNACAKACPSDCIVVEGVKKEGEKKKSPTLFTLDYTLCSLCSACVEVCPTDALEHSKRYNLAATTKTVFNKIDLIKDLEERKK